MGCHRRLELCSPAKSLRLRVYHSFCACVRQSLSSLQLPEPKKAFPSTFIQFSHFRTPATRAPLSVPRACRGALVFPMLPAVSVIPLHFISSTASATHTCRWFHSTHFHPTGTVQPTASFPPQSNRQQKHAPNPCAYCRGRRLSNPCPFPALPLAQLADGSRRSIQPVSVTLLQAFIPLAAHTPVS